MMWWKTIVDVLNRVLSDISKDHVRTSANLFKHFLLNKPTENGIKHTEKNLNYSH